jgi:hypothetical protein
MEFIMEEQPGGNIMLKCAIVVPVSLDRPPIFEVYPAEFGSFPLRQHGPLWRHVFVYCISCDFPLEGMIANAWLIAFCDVVWRSFS